MFHAVLSSHNPGHWARPSSLVHISSHLGRHPNLWPHLWFFFHGETSAQLLCLALPKGFHPGTHASACQFPQQKKKKKKSKDYQVWPHCSALHTVQAAASVIHHSLSCLLCQPGGEGRHLVSHVSFLPAIFMPVSPLELSVYCWQLLHAASSSAAHTDRNGPSQGSKPRGKPHGLLRTAQKVKSTG